jgi:hypothetical protein
MLIWCSLSAQSTEFTSSKAYDLEGVSPLGAKSIAGNSRGPQSTLLAPAFQLPLVLTAV